MTGQDSGGYEESNLVSDLIDVGRELNDTHKMSQPLNIFIIITQESPFKIMAITRIYSDS